MIIDLPRFIAAERPTWTELEKLLDHLAEETNQKLTYEEAQRFHYLYQKVSSDLARLTTFASEPQLRLFLESLVARAYAEIHETREAGARWRVDRWLLHGFPAAFRRHTGAFILSLLITLAGVAFGGLAITFDDEAKAALVPGGFGHLMGDPAERVREEEQAKADPMGGAHAGFAGQLMTHNIRVSVFSLAMGMTAGVGTVIVLFHNGVILGLVSIDYILAGQTIFLLGWLMPHGVIEIPAILIASQAGLVLGGAMLRRGDRQGLGARLRAVSADVMHLIGGVAVMLVWAGLVESFFSQHHQPVLPYWLKISFGAAEFAVLCWWLGARKGAEPAA